MLYGKSAIKRVNITLDTILESCKSAVGDKSVQVYRTDTDSGLLQLKTISASSYHTEVMGPTVSQLKLVLISIINYRDYVNYLNDCMTDTQFHEFYKTKALQVDIWDQYVRAKTLAVTVDQSIDMIAGGGNVHSVETMVDSICVPLMEDIDDTTGGKTYLDRILYPPKYEEKKADGQ